MKLRLSVLLLVLPLMVHAQKKESVIQFDPYGFISVQSYHNSRQNVQAVGGLLNLYPIDKDIDVNGDDRNGHSNASLFGVLTRFGLKISGPEVLGANSTGQVEIEFTGINNKDNPILYRHAFFALGWDNDKLTLGQTWHPMSGEVAPTSMGIAFSSPFNPLNRSPQLRYDRKLGSGVRVSAVALFQYLNSSVGPAGRSSEYQVNSKTPELYIGADYTSGGFRIGAGLDFQHLSPRVKDVAGNHVNENLDALSAILQTQYLTDHLSLKAKVLYGENMSQLGICSGYGAYATKSDNPSSYKWEPLKAVSSWCSAQYGNDLKVGIFGGYMQNLGSSKDLLAGLVYVNGPDNIDRMCRISPNVQYNIGNMNLGCEYEMTSVAYGTTAIDGTVSDTHWVTNNRLLISVTYNFR